MTRLRSALALAAGLCWATAGLAAAPPARLAWRQGDAVLALQRVEAGAEPLPAASLRTPLGSVWKVFVYSYLAERGVAEPAYRCTADERPPDDDYCCDPGGSVGRDEALARSCGPYFEPARLAISGQAWTRYWKKAEAPAWLQSLSAMRPGTEVPVADLLDALAHVPAPARLAARRALLPVSMRDEAVLAALGSGPRFKTWSWFVGGERAGGAAGWLADATPFWFEAAGTSKTALHGQAGWIAGQWRSHGVDAPRADADMRAAEPCIDVAFFQRYPLREVTRADGSAASDGPLHGRHVVAFRNGTRLPVDAVPALSLVHDRDGPAIVGRLLLEDYVARVVDREGAGAETAAARALAVAARTYVLQNASEAEGCRVIADDSRTQRVGVNPPSRAAQAAAAFTEGLVLEGVAVHYHRDQAGADTMSWLAAVEASRRGDGFEAILRAAYPAGRLAGAQAASECTPMPLAEQWLAERQQRWRALLRAQAGYEPPGSGVHVCQLALGMPHSDQRRLQIRVREWQSRDGRVTLIHEYLHLAFRNHPRGGDEVFVERLAQQLADL